jgi:hypothetical protein
MCIIKHMRLASEPVIVIETAIDARTFWHNPVPSLPADVIAVIMMKHVQVYMLRETPPSYCSQLTEGISGSVSFIAPFLSCVTCGAVVVRQSDENGL